MPQRCVFFAVVLFAAAFSHAEAPSWVDRHALAPPTAASEVVAASSEGALPQFTCTPEAAGSELVRVSLPFAPGTFPAEMGLEVLAGQARITPQVRVLTLHPGQPQSVRRALVTFPLVFDSAAPQSFQLQFAPALGEQPSHQLTAPRELTAGPYTITFENDRVSLTREQEPVFTATLIAPAHAEAGEPALEIVEEGPHYLWARLFLPDAAWPRIIEIRCDALGRVAVRAHLQRMTEEGGETAPDFGWHIELPAAVNLPRHTFAEGQPATVSAGAVDLNFPDAHLLRRGYVEAQEQAVTYMRCTADEHVPHQLAAWRTATFATASQDVQPLTALLEPPLQVAVDTDAYAPLYAIDFPAELKPWPALDALMDFHLDSIAGSSMYGDDFGNVGSMPGGGVFSMNRLNHCPPIFHAYYATQDARLREIALQWCDNFHDLSIWWGEGREGEFGGTRYNNRAAMEQGHETDPSFMWRSDTAVHFCTKGYDSFFYAWEETGDPRMATALRWQTDYAARMVHANQGEARNIGDVLDFVRLYEFTRQTHYLEHGLRLFQELREKLSEGDLFSQGGQPIVADSPFIDMDDEGYEAPFAKPYIIGYALAGLPLLAKHTQEEPRLLDVVRAVAQFLAESQDPTGGWRYPHPQSSRVLLGQAMEHAAQLARAAEVLEAHGEDIQPLLNAIERTLQARLLAFHRSGQYLTNLDGWERSDGTVGPGESVKPLYARPQDRDPARDYTEGAIATGGNSPEGVVYFPEVLAFYLRHRPAERLHHATPQLAQVLERMPENPPALSAAVTPPAFPGHGIIKDNLVTFYAEQKARLTFPLAWSPEKFPDFAAWRAEARAKVLECLLTPPPCAAFAPEVVAVEDRGTYEARKLMLNLSGFYRVPAYLLVPKQPGPHPAVVALHDHGAHFSIGKEKVVRPFGVNADVLADATDWTNKYYGGRWIGDALAEQGYVVFAIDALFWGERGRAEGVDYEAQQAVSANLLQLGMTWPGVINWDDIRSAEFVASLPDVDPARIAAMGLSMGCHRTWMLSALSDHIAAGVAICWMGTTDALMVPGNNQTTGQSAYSMLVPNLRNFLDYPHVASIACPKPMLFFNGTQDALFPVPGVEDAYAQMHTVWDAQGASDKLYTRLWDVPHEFNAAMQDDAFAWLARQFGVE